MTQRLTDQVAVVTGAGQGVGEGIARALAAEGATVVVSGRTLAKCERVAGEITTAGGRAIAHECDVQYAEQPRAMVERISKELGRLDIVVNNAQGGHMGTSVPLVDITDEQALEFFLSGPLGSLHLMQAAFPLLKERGGSVVNVASTIGLIGDRGQASYAMAKEAIRGLTKCAAREWGRYDIRVNAVAPVALTPSAEHYREESQQRWDDLMRRIPLRRMGDSEHDIGQAVLGLVTDMHYVTGVTLMLDGGQTILH